MTSTQTARQAIEGIYAFLTANPDGTTDTEQQALAAFQADPEATIARGVAVLEQPAIETRILFTAADLATAGTNPQPTATGHKEPAMTVSKVPRYTVVEQPYGGHAVRDTHTGQGVTARGDILETQDTCEAMNRLDALGIKAGDTVTGWNTSTTNPRRITVTVDREPWASGYKNVIVSDGRSVEALRLAGLTVQHN